MALQNISIRNLRGQGDGVVDGGVATGTRNLRGQGDAVAVGGRQQVGVRNSGGTQRPL